jgi:hypothetical protein
LQRRLPLGEQRLLARDDRLGRGRFGAEPGGQRQQLVAAHANQRTDLCRTARDAVLGQGLGPGLGVRRVAVDQRTVHVDQQRREIGQVERSAGPSPRPRVGAVATIGHDAEPDHCADDGHASRQRMGAQARPRASEHA